MGVLGGFGCENWVQADIQPTDKHSKNTKANPRRALGFSVGSHPTYQSPKKTIATSSESTLQAVNTVLSATDDGMLG
ncbi:MAG: hypothetical protein ABSA96_20530 [Candidatus Acidiferrales bacterium]